jgi:hypothetical protein
MQILLHGQIVTTMQTCSEVPAAQTRSALSLLRLPAAELNSACSAQTL